MGISGAVFDDRSFSVQAFSVESFLFDIEIAADEILGGGWVERPSLAQVELERIRLGISEPIAKKLKKVLRLAVRKTKTDKELNKQLLIETAKEEGLTLNQSFAIYLYILLRIRDNAIDDLKARNLLHALEVYELRRIEEADIVFVISMLAAEIYA